MRGLPKTPESDPLHQNLRAIHPAFLEAIESLPKMAVETPFDLLWIQFKKSRNWISLDELQSKRSYEIPN